MSIYDFQVHTEKDNLFCLDWILREYVERSYGHTMDSMPFLLGWNAYNQAYCDKLISYFSIPKDQVSL